MGSPDYLRHEFQINQTDLLAGTTQHYVSPITGYFKGLSTVVQAAVTTGGTLTPKCIPAVLNTEGGLDMTSFTGNISGDTLVAGSGSLGAVAGLAQTIANAATAGTVQNTTVTQGDPSTFVVKGQAIEIDIAGFATAGAINGFLEFANDNLFHL